jgi:hypothetical protein
MHFKQFTNKIKSSVLQLQVVEQSSCYNVPLYKTAEGKVYIDMMETEFKSLDEARSYIKEQNSTQVIEQEVTKNIYEDVLENKIAAIIKSENDVKVTQSILEHYIDLASSKRFTLDETVLKIRKLNKHDYIFEDKIDFVLKDNSRVVIAYDTKKLLNNILKNQKEIIDYMSESKENFLEVLDLLTEE